MIPTKYKKWNSPGKIRVNTEFADYSENFNQPATTKSMIKND
jgi:hypothetical protein